MQIHVEGPLFYVSLAGEMDGRLAEKTYREVLRECVAGGRSKLLIDCRALSGELSTTDRYSLGQLVADENASVAAREAGRQVRVALVGSQPFIDRDRFGETVAVNRGAAVKVTEDLASAYRFLGLEPPAE
ncbi:MAG TPA: hypothetical protein VM890_03710 [Longimicrobium sp.]|nr:hypothetical protein [Longimicrobium sp.]